MDKQSHINPKRKRDEKIEKVFCGVSDGNGVFYNDVCGTNSRP